MRKHPKSHQGCKGLNIKSFPHKHTHTPKSGELLFSLLPCSSHIGFAVDFRVQLVQKEPEELLCVLLTGSNTETREAFLFMSVLQEAISIQVSKKTALELVGKGKIN